MPSKATHNLSTSKNINNILSITNNILNITIFVVSINGRPWHSVAIDESHEMQVLSDKKILIGLFVSEMGGSLQLHIS